MDASGVARADLALVFTTADAYRQGAELLRAVRGVTAATSIVGCSGAGVLTERGEAEGVAAVAVLVVSTGGEPEVKPFLVSGMDTLGGDAGAEISRRTGMAGSEDGCLLVLPDATSLSPEDFLLGLGSRLDPVPVVGGVAAGMPPFELYDADVIHGAVAGLAVSASPIVGVAQACEPIG